MSKEMIVELPVTAEDPVTLAYLHNHLFQVKAWIGNLNRAQPSEKLEAAYEFVELAQNQIEVLAKAQSGEKAS